MPPQDRKTARQKRVARMREAGVPAKEIRSARDSPKETRNALRRAHRRTLRTAGFSPQEADRLASKKRAQPVREAQAFKRGKEVRDLMRQNAPETVWRGVAARERLRQMAPDSLENRVDLWSQFSSSAATGGRFPPDFERFVALMEWRLIREGKDPNDVRMHAWGLTHEFWVNEGFDFPDAEDAFDRYVSGDGGV